MNKPLLFSWIISIIATSGSLYFSEVLHYVPCTFCWYQRILMYPLVFLLGRAFYDQELKIYRYILPLSILGMLVSGYHYSLQKIPALQQFEMCQSGVPCSGEYINWLGFITIPLLAFTAFSFITVCMGILMSKNNND
ncbi:disulfide oxidoreductase [Peribacillus butanolivorans]|jgi:disulfide bond formation protein DsbB|uniref:Probable disulfide formation protein n=1 Tax=Peribacillus butanolivorans TaxID=421767 RepID=A0AAX0RZU2_9BACI|nr:MULTISPECIES: disulfide oxidoreductase [Peribacillus]KQU26271.1 2-oxoglutarate dehydrogenase [Bacillus sp. Leaf13]KRF62574.1 2-oxoglutarate dehydrogenase [Bacillus sp. Soil768D1]AXN38376.1 disulfide bond formation protein B [Peribacillus butanolivorans]KON70906.1 2-oxoglutarate dehydrogenase [Peribacillus butanolivorans]MBK5443521.1 disulfide bond formation protein B [Peribacillus sp. TH24]